MSIEAPFAAGTRCRCSAGDERARRAGQARDHTGAPGATAAPAKFVPPIRGEAAGQHDQAGDEAH